MLHAATREKKSARSGMAMRALSSSEKTRRKRGSSGSRSGSGLQFLLLVDARIHVAGDAGEAERGERRVRLEVGRERENDAVSLVHAADRMVPVVRIA